MNNPSERSTNPEIPQLDPPLESAVWAVIGERVPSDAIARVKQRAKALATQESEETPSAPTVAAETSARSADRSQKSWMQIGVSLATVASVLAIVTTLSLAPTVSLAQVLRESIAQRWIHGTTTWFPATNGEAESDVSPSSTESWASAEQEILVVCMPNRIMFEDRKSEIAVNYEIGSPKVVTTLPIQHDMKAIHTSSSVLEQLLAMQDETNKARMAISNVKKRQLSVEGELMLEYSYHMSRPGSQVNDRDVRLLVNAETQLLESMEEKYPNGMRNKTTFDYPETGPTDIYAAGVPRDTEIVDRKASTDVRQVAGLWSKARVEFDDYDLIYVQVPEGLKSSVTSGLNTNIKRVRRSGNRYRVDVLLRPMPGVESPDETTDMDKWWRENRDRYWSAPELICDGSSITTYLLVDGRLSGDAEPNLNVKLRVQHPVHGRGDDRPAAWAELMPEYAVRPHLWTTIDSRTFEYEPVPDDGPEGAVRLVVKKPGELHEERHRHWLDPDKRFCVVKTVHPVFEPKSDAKQVAYIDTKVASGFRQSPRGFWYPTRVDRDTTTGTNTQIRTYHLEFTDDVDPELFVPLELNGQK